MDFENLYINVGYCVYIKGETVHMITLIFFGRGNTGGFTGIRKL